MTKAVLLLLVTLLVPFVLCDEDTHQFKSETSKLLQIIVNSLYQHRDVFLREVISNAADAINKHRSNQLQENGVVSGDTPYEIKIIPNKDERTVTIRDTGVSMTKEELIRNLGTLGTSGTQRFLQAGSAEEGNMASTLIGQFGVGFYSVFLVGDTVKVASIQEGSDKQYVWESTADDTFRVYEDPRGNTLAPRGTEIIIELKEDADEFMEVDKIKEHVGKYSEFIDFPIYVQTTKTEKVPKKKEEGEEEAEKEEKPEGEEGDEDSEEGSEEEEEEEEMEEITTHDWELINEQKPIWLRKAADIEKDEYNAFFKAITKETEDPLYYTHFNAEGEVEFKSILYVPSKAPFNLFDHTAGTMTNIRLYVRRVFITDSFSDLLPRYLNFLRGVVDSDDLPLNVSREVLQENRLLKVIRKKLIRKALQMFQSIAEEDEDEKKEDDEEKKEKDEEAKEKDEAKEEEAEKEEEKKEKKYPKFWSEFGKNLRLGLIEDSTHRARLTKLLRYKSSANDEFVGLEDYVDRMKEGQKGIFYLTGESLDAIKKSPLLEKAKRNKVEVLYLSDAIDEYVVGHVTEYSGHKLINLAKEQISFFETSERDKKVEQARTEAWKPFTDWLKKTLGSKIEKAVVSDRIEETPCVLVSPQYGVTARMQKILEAQALASDSSKQVAKRIMEVNPRHPIIDELRRRVKEDEDDQSAKNTAKLLYDAAALQTGFGLEDPNEFATRMASMMKTSLNLDEDAGLVEEEEYQIEEEEEEDEEEEGEEEEGDEEEAEEKEAKDEL